MQKRNHKEFNFSGKTCMLLNFISLSLWSLALLGANSHGTRKMLINIHILLTQLPKNQIYRKKYFLVKQKFDFIRK